LDDGVGVILSGSSSGEMMQRRRRRRRRRRRSGWSSRAACGSAHDEISEQKICSSGGRRQHPVF
jgi:hypothetical protein